MARMGGAGCPPRLQLYIQEQERTGFGIRAQVDANPAALIPKLLPRKLLSLSSRYALRRENFSS